MPENNQDDLKAELSESEDCAIKFSARLVELLGTKMREHNKESAQSKVSLSQLKIVYSNAAKNYSYAGYSRGEWALARVNLFLRVAKGEKADVISSYERTSLGGLVFEAKIISEDEHDVSLKWVPSQIDFTTAKSEIKEHKLNYHFSSVGELYLEDYTRTSFNTY
jgi:hypothetical protein|tara:strand:- start:9773 stop:10267 length:495 start_codon:yes stop_codon:yes gene_type:complete